MILFYRYGVIDKMKYDLLFSNPIRTSGYSHDSDKIEEDILNTLSKYQPLIKNLMKEFNLEL